MAKNQDCLYGSILALNLEGSQLSYLDDAKVETKWVLGRLSLLQSSDHGQKGGRRWYLCILQCILAPALIAGMRLSVLVLTLLSQQNACQLV